MPTVPQNMREHEHNILRVDNYKTIRDFISGGIAGVNSGVDIGNAGCSRFCQPTCCRTSRPSGGRWLMRKLGSILAEQRRQRLGEVARRIANATEAVQDGRIYIEKTNGQFLFKEGGTPAEYSAALAYTVAKGWLWKHESGTYVKFTPAGAELFA
jgi:hypothetical protein